MAAEKPVQAPRHLSTRAKKFWAQIAADYELGEHHFHLLKLACEALDRAEECRVILAKDGPVYHDRFGAPRAHPACSIERDARAAFARLIAQLGFDTSEPKPDARFATGRRIAKGQR